MGYIIPNYLMRMKYIFYGERHMYLIVLHQQNKESILKCNQSVLNFCSLAHFHKKHANHHKVTRQYFQQITGHFNYFQGQVETVFFLLKIYTGTWYQAVLIGTLKKPKCTIGGFPFMFYTWLPAKHTEFTLLPIGIIGKRNKTFKEKLVAVTA